MTKGPQYMSSNVFMDLLKCPAQLWSSRSVRSSTSYPWVCSPLAQLLLQLNIRIMLAHPWHSMVLVQGIHGHFELLDFAITVLDVNGKGLPGRDSRTRGYLVSPTLNHGMKKINPLKMRRSDIKSVNYCQNCYFCSGKCKEDTAILASVIFH